MGDERRTGLLYSAALHFFIALLAVFGLPSILNPPDREPQAITVELLPIAAVSNVKPAESKPKEKPKEEKKAEEKKKPAPPVKTEDAPPPPPAPDKKPDKKKEEKKKEEKKPDKKEDKKKPKEKKPDLAAILKSVKETAAREKAAETAESEEESKSKSDLYNPGLPLSISEKDAIRSQIARCWNVPAGAKDAHELIVVLKLQYERDGTLIQVELASASKARYASDSFYRAAADSAIRAVRQCSPLANLPPDKYQTWRDMELTFDPKQMLY